MASVDDDQWVTRAMADDSLVAEQLLRIRRHKSPIFRHWPIRQRRTLRLPETTAQLPRASPTTPLSWTAATSVDGYGGSARASAPPHASGSKAVDQSETTAAAAKRSNKKRTLAELQREEKLKLKERMNLREELAAMTLSAEKQRASNERLKRMKLDMMSKETLKTRQAVVDPPQSVEAHCGLSNLASAQTVQAPSNPPELNGHNRAFLVPDLNLPLEDDSNDNDQAN